MNARRTPAKVLPLIAAVVVPVVAAEVSLRLVVGKITASVFVDRPGFERSRGVKPS